MKLRPSSIYVDFVVSSLRKLDKVANFANCLADEDGIDPNLVYLLKFKQYTKRRVIYNDKCVIVVC